MIILINMNTQHNMHDFVHIWVLSSRILDADWNHLASSNPQTELSTTSSTSPLFLFFFPGQTCSERLNVTLENVFVCLFVQGNLEFSTCLRYFMGSESLRFRFSQGLIFLYLQSTNIAMIVQSSQVRKRAPKNERVCRRESVVTVFKIYLFSPHCYRMTDNGYVCCYGVWAILWNWVYSAFIYLFKCFSQHFSFRWDAWVFVEDFFLFWMYVCMCFFFFLKKKRLYGNDYLCRC